MGVTAIKKIFNNSSQVTEGAGGHAATGTAFIAPDERLAVGGQALVSTEEA